MKPMKAATNSIHLLHMMISLMPFNPDQTDTIVDLSWYLDVARTPRQDTCMNRHLAQGIPSR